MRIEPADASPGDPLLIAEDRPDGERTVVAFTDILTDEEGQPELHGYVVDGGRFDSLASSFKSRIIRRTLAAAALVLGAIFLFKPPFLAAAQWACDFLPF